MSHEPYRILRYSSQVQNDGETDPLHLNDISTPNDVRPVLSLALLSRYHDLEPEHVMFGASDWMNEDKGGVQRILQPVDPRHLASRSAVCIDEASRTVSFGGFVKPGPALDLDHASDIDKSKSTIATAVLPSVLRSREHHILSTKHGRRTTPLPYDGDVNKTILREEIITAWIFDSLGTEIRIQPWKKCAEQKGGGHVQY